MGKNWHAWNPAVAICQNKRWGRGTGWKKGKDQLENMHAQAQGLDNGVLMAAGAGVWGWVAVGNSGVGDKSDICNSVNRREKICSDSKLSCVLSKYHY